MNLDPLLRKVVSIALQMGDETQGGVELAITLFVGGMLVSGYIVSSRHFALHHPLTDKMLETIELLEKKGLDPEDLLSDDGSEFLHLSRAHFFIPGHPPIPSSDEGVFWRGRLSDISGFCFGILTQLPNAD